MDGITSFNTHTDIVKKLSYVSETLLSKQQNWFVGLGTQDFWFYKFNWAPIDFDKSMSALAVSDSGGILLAAKHLY